MVAPKPRRPLSPFVKASLAGGGLLLFLLVLGLVLRALLFHLPHEAREAIKAPSPPPPEVHEKGAEVEERVRSFLKSGEDAGPRELRLSEEDIAALLQSSPEVRKYAPQARILGVEVHPEAVTVKGLVNVENRWLYVEVEGTVKLLNPTTIQILPLRFRVGRMRLPSFIERRILQKLGRVGPLTYRLPFSVSSLTLEEGAIVLRR